MPTSISRNEEKVSLRKYEDYNNGTKTLSKNPNPKYTICSLTKNKPREQTSFINLLCGTL
jgi:hypothetical protein